MQVTHLARIAALLLLLIIIILLLIIIIILIRTILLLLVPVTGRLVRLNLVAISGEGGAVVVLRLRSPANLRIRTERRLEC